MTLPAWPIANTILLQEGYDLQRMRDPLETDMEGGNSRSRSRPGDNVGTLTQKVRLYPADYDAVVEWVKTTLNNGTSRFTMDVWLGTSTANKVCKFVKPGSNMKPEWIGPDAIDLPLTLLVFGV
jgi:hypothetical protein